MPDGGRERGSSAPDDCAGEIGRRELGEKHLRFVARGSPHGIVAAERLDDGESSLVMTACRSMLPSTIDIAIREVHQQDGDKKAAESRALLGFAGPMSTDGCKTVVTSADKAFIRLSLSMESTMCFGEDACREENRTRVQCDGDGWLEWRTCDVEQGPGAGLGNSRVPFGHS